MDITIPALHSSKSRRESACRHSHPHSCPRHFPSHGQRPTTNDRRAQNRFRHNSRFTSFVEPASLHQSIDNYCHGASFSTQPGRQCGSICSVRLLPISRDPEDLSLCDRSARRLREIGARSPNPISALLQIGNWRKLESRTHNWVFAFQ